MSNYRECQHFVKWVSAWSQKGGFVTTWHQRKIGSRIWNWYVPCYWSFHLCATVSIGGSMMIKKGQAPDAILWSVDWQTMTCGCKAILHSIFCTTVLQQNAAALSKLNELKYGRPALVYQLISGSGESARFRFNCCCSKRCRSCTSCPAHPRQRKYWLVDWKQLGQPCLLVTFAKFPVKEWSNLQKVNHDFQWATRIWNACITVYGPFGSIGHAQSPSQQANAQN